MRIYLAFGYLDRFALLNKQKKKRGRPELGSYVLAFAVIAKIMQTA